MSGAYYAEKHGEKSMAKKSIVKKGSVKKNISVKLPDDLITSLRHAAEERDASASDVVREALAEYLAKPLEMPGSALDLAGDLVGSVEGSSDLATNPKHMRGFGR